MALSDERILDVVQPHLPEYGHAKIWDTNPQYAEAVGIEDKDARWTVQELRPEHTIAIARSIEAEARRDALEEAEKVCDQMHEEDRPGDYAYAIRALKESPPPTA